MNHILAISRHGPKGAGVLAYEIPMNRIGRYATALQRWVDSGGAVADRTAMTRLLWQYAACECLSVKVLNRPNVRVLEAGAGDGLFCRYLSSRYPQAQVTGLAYAPDPIAQLGQHEQAGERIPHHRKYDVVISTSALRCLTWYQQAFWNLCGVLDDQAVLVLTLDFAVEGGRPRDSRVLSCYEIEMLIQVARDAGLNLLPRPPRHRTTTYTELNKAAANVVEGVPSHLGVIAFRRRTKASKGYFLSTGSQFEPTGLISSSYRREVHYAVKTGGHHVEQRQMLTPEEFSRRSSSLASPHAMLVVGPMGLGDALMLTPSLRAMKEAWPGCPVHVCCRMPEYEMLLHNPSIDVLMTMPYQWEWNWISAHYKRVVSTYGIIAGKARAEWHNAYELIAEEMGCVPTDYRPAYYPTTTEIRQAAADLRGAGVDLEHERIVVIHPQSTSNTRSIPLATVACLTQRLKEDGTRALVILKEEPGYDAPRGAAGLWTSVHFHGLSMRAIAAMVHHASAVIAIDSVVSHLSAAMDKPSVLLYGPIAAELRCAHFPRAIPLQSQAPCAPCFQQGRNCISIRSVENPPHCMSFSADEILGALRRATRGDYRRARVTARQFTPPICCDLCAHHLFEPYARRGNTAYFRCCRCGSVQVSRPAGSNPAGAMQVPDRQQLRSSQLLLQARLTAVLMAIAPDLARAKSMQPSVLAVGGLVDLSADCLGETTQEPLDPAKNGASDGPGKDNLRRRSGYDFICLLHAVHFACDWQRRVRALVRRQRETGCLVCTYFASESIGSPAYWEFLQYPWTPYLQRIPSRQGLRASLEGLRYREVFASRLDSVSWVSVFKRSGGRFRSAKSPTKVGTVHS